MSPCLFPQHLQKDQRPPFRYCGVIHNWLRNINLIPFCGVIATFFFTIPPSPKERLHSFQWRYSRGFPYRLGSAYSCINAIDMKPFSTSVLKLSKSTPEEQALPMHPYKCIHLSNCYYHQDLHWRSIPQLVTQLKVLHRPHASSYFSLFQPALPTLHNERKVSVVDHNEYLSAIHFRDRSIRQVSCYTLLSGCRLPWPPSCCLNESTPFLGSLSILSLAP